MTEKTATVIYVDSPSQDVHNSTKQSCKFKSVRQAIFWFINHNPAREKHVNLLEPERGATRIALHFSGEHHDDLYVAVLGAMRKTLADYNWIERCAFNLCELGRPELITGGMRIHPDYAAKALGTKRRYVYTALTRISEQLEKELQKRGLIAV